MNNKINLKVLTAASFRNSDVQINGNFSFENNDKKPLQTAIKPTNKKLKNYKIMKRLFSYAFAVLVIFSAQSQAWNSEPGGRGLFGTDGRAEANTKWEYNSFVRATATSFWAPNVDSKQKNKIWTRTLRGSIKKKFEDKNFDYISSDINFLDQPNPGTCTGFLIAPDILVTAGHCIENEEDLKNLIWCFDFNKDVPFTKTKEDLGYITVNENNLYHGVEILATKLTQNSYDYDYCVIRLDRKTNRKPYKFRTGGQINIGDFVAMIGSPSGLPLKIADSATITNADFSTYFYTDLDAFHGNSGGPVFNSNGYIEGILVRGPGNDFHYDSTCNCIKPDVHYDFMNLFGLPSRKGNAVHRINYIPAFLLVAAVQSNLESAIINNDINEFNEWAGYNWFFSDKMSSYEKYVNPIWMAINYGRTEMVDSILRCPNVNYNMEDAEKIPLICKLASGNFAAQLERICNTTTTDINLKNPKNGRTALMEAAAAGNEQAVITLLNHGADTKMVDSYGATARKIAKSIKTPSSKKIAGYLKKAEKGKWVRM